MNKRSKYSPPIIEVIQIQVESGIAGSLAGSDGGIDDMDITPLSMSQNMMNQSPQYTMNMRKQKSLAVVLTAVLALAAAGCSNELPQNENFPVPEENAGITVISTASMPQGNPDTRLIFDETNPNKLQITWKEASESFSVMKTAQAAPATFTQTEISTSNPKQATFEGMITDKQGDFYALYPALPQNITTATAADLTLDMSGQSGEAMDESKVYMYGKTTYSAENGLAFNFQHLTCILRVKLIFPTSGNTDLDADMDVEPLTRTANPVTGVTLYGTGVNSRVHVNLTGDNPAYSNPTPGMLVLSGSFAPDAAGDFKVYLHLIPGEMDAVKITATKDGKPYSGIVLSVSRTLAAGKMYTADVTMEAAKEFDSTVASGSSEEPSLLNNGAENAADNPYLIASPQNLRWLAKLLEDTQESAGTNPTTGKFYRLTTDINVTADTWTEIGKNGSYASSPQNFDGSFDGNGHIISGELTSAESNGYYFGLFGFCGSNSEISNLHMDATVMHHYYSKWGGSTWTGSVAGYSKGTITGCTNKGTITISNTSTNLYTGDTNYTGGIVGEGNDISNCSNAGSVNGGKNNCVYIGGIAGQCEGNCTGCSNSADLTIDNGKSWIGGIIGYITGSNAKTIVVENCTNTGKIEGKGAGTVVYTSGIAGGNDYYSNVSLTYTNCTNTGNVTGGTNNYANTGGIVGYGQDAKFHLCHNSGAITPESDESKQIYTGGICGRFNIWNGVTRDGKVYNCCTNTGTPAQYVGNVVAEGAPDICDEGHPTH